jgi:hypothetical protein
MNKFPFDVFTPMRNVCLYRHLTDTELGRHLARERLSVRNSRELRASEFRNRLLGAVLA